MPSSRAQRGLGGVAGHPSQTAEPDQNKAEPWELSPSGSAQGTLALSLPTPHLRVSSSPGPGGPQEEGWSGVGPRKGAVPPTEGRRGQRSWGLDAGAGWALGAVSRGVHTRRSVVPSPACHSAQRPLDPVVPPRPSRLPSTLDSPLTGTAWASEMVPRWASSVPAPRSRLSPRLWSAANRPR